eukprot:jgi/Chlat1/6991/Chrsp56S06678
MSAATATTPLALLRVPTASKSRAGRTISKPSTALPGLGSVAVLPARLPRRRLAVRASAEGGDAQEEQKKEEPARKPAGMSKEMQDKLRQEYLGLGGAPNVKMSSNYFLWISIVIGALAIAFWLQTGGGGGGYGY